MLTPHQLCHSHLKSLQKAPDRFTHRLTIKAMEILALVNTASILLARTLHFCGISSGSSHLQAQVQASANEIFQIAGTLRKLNLLHLATRGFLWPLPLFVAALEIEDRHLREWAIGYIKEMQEWGPKMQPVGEVLQRICERQGRKQTQKVRVWDVLKKVGGEVII